MKKKFFVIFIMTALIALAGCNENASELKTRNEELRIKNAALQATVEDLNRQLNLCKERRIKNLTKYDPSATNPDDNSIY